MSTVIIIVPVLVGLVTFYFAQRQLGKKNRLLRKMYDSQVKFLKHQVRKLEREKLELEEKIKLLHWENKRLETEKPVLESSPWQDDHQADLNHAIQELSSLKKSEAVLQRKLDSDVVILQEKDELVTRLMTRIQELEAAYWEQRDHAETLSKNRPSHLSEQSSL